MSHCLNNCRCSDCEMYRIGARAGLRKLPGKPERRDPSGAPYTHNEAANESAKGKAAVSLAYKRCADFAKAEHLRLGKKSYTGAIEALMNCHTQFEKWGLQ